MTWKTIFDGEVSPQSNAKTERWKPAIGSICVLSTDGGVTANVFFKLGDTLRVTFDGVVYTEMVTAKPMLFRTEASSGDYVWDIQGIGNAYLSTGNSTLDTGEPFALYCPTQSAIMFNGSGTHTLKVEVASPNFSVSTGNGCTIYNGIEVSTLPQTDHPYAVLIANYDEKNVVFHQAHLICVDKPFSYDSSTGKCKTDATSHQWYSLDSQNGKWTDLGVIPVSPTPSMGLDGNVYQRMWTNTDIDGYLAATDPVEISSATDSAVTVSFECSNLYSIDPVYQVKMWMYIKGTPYSLATITWKSEMFTGSNHNERYIFTGLEPNTEYEVYTVLYTNGEETNYKSTITFTTLGTGEVNTGFNAYIGIDNVTRQIESCFIGINNVAREVSKIYLGDGNGIARLVFKGNMSLAELPVGSSVFMKVDDTPTEFLIVHQGLPDATLYDASCDGTWLLMKNVYGRNMMFGTNVDDFQTSDVRLELNDVIFFNFDPAIQNVIKQVKIPHYKSGSNASVASGANGLPSKLFLLSGYEIGWTTANDDAFPADGAVLDYFKGCAADDPKRIAYDNSGDPACWWLRSIVMGSYKSAWSTWDGEAWAENFTTLNSIRPALILPKDVAVDSEFNIIV